MNVLFAVWELDPFFKFGGLGDVARTLPGALATLGVDIRIILPYYKALKLSYYEKSKVGHLTVKFAGKEEHVEISSVVHPTSKVLVYLLRNRKYLDVAKSADTFAFFNLAVVESILTKKLPFVPEIIHCNDHHTSFIPLLTKERKLPVKTILTIHNLSYQGRASVDILEKLGLSKSKCRVLHWESKFKQVNFLMEGIIHADIVNTVSPTYAKEIMTDEFGYDLEEVLLGKEGRVFGIINGIDVDYLKNIMKQSIAYPYGKHSEKALEVKKKFYHWPEGKKLNKLYLQKKLGLSISDKIPIYSFIGRFDPKQKGMDILHKMMRRINLENIQFCILGSGDKNWEERFQWLCKFYPENVSCNFKFDEVLAHQIYAASDFMIIPSKFEPCGLVQMIAMFFGTLPIAHRTGGLIDTIRENVDGILFEKYTSESLERAVKKAHYLWQAEKSRYKIMVEAAIAADFSWKSSAAEYVKLYEGLVKGEY